MKPSMKNIFFGFALAIILSWPVLPASTPAKPEAQLLKAKGKERIAVLVELAGYYKENNPQQAITYGKEALGLLETYPDNKARTGLSLHLGTAYSTLGDFAAAKKHAMEGLSGAKAAGDPRATADAKAALGKICRTLKEMDLARDFYLESSKLYESLGLYPNALVNHKHYKDVKDQIFNDKTALQISGMEKDYALANKKSERERLEKDREYQRKTLYFLLLFAFLIAALAFFLFTRYRIKTRISRLLETEIRERREAEEKLRESEEKFKALAEKSVVGIRIIRDQVVKYANPRFLDTFGYTREEMLGKDPLEVAVEEDRPLMAQHLVKRMTGDSGSVSYEFKGLTKTGDIIYLGSHGSAILYQGQPAVLESVVDITRRKNTEAELIKSRKMESVGILAGGIAHDFNNLLAVILGNTSMLKMSLGKSNLSHLDSLENVEKATAQASDLAQKFITFSEGGWLFRKKVQLHQIIKDMSHLSPELKGISYAVSIPPGLYPIYGDDRQLRQVLTNLLLNAHEAISGDKREISLHAENITFAKENPFSLKAGQYVKISVTDNGKGIPPEFRERVFDPYFSTKDTMSQKGLGLGLAICYSVIQKHEGHIEILSEIQKGTTVNLYVPIYKE